MSVHDTAELRAPGICVPAYTPTASNVLAPLTNVHVPLLTVYRHKSFRSPMLAPLPPQPWPPNIHRLPDWSVHDTAESRAPGIGVPVYTLTAFNVLAPLTHVHVPLLTE